MSGSNRWTVGVGIALALGACRPDLPPNPSPNSGFSAQVVRLCEVDCRDGVKCGIYGENALPKCRSDCEEWATNLAASKCESEWISNMECANTLTCAERDERIDGTEQTQGHAEYPCRQAFEVWAACAR